VSETATRVQRRRWCACSRADVMHKRWRDICPLHGSTPEAKAYQDGLADGARLADRDAALRKLVDRGTGVDLMPTVNPAATDAAWWYDYMRGLDNQWRSHLRAALSGPADAHPADGTDT
jgi:hypothetical protein